MIENFIKNRIQVCTAFDKIFVKNAIQAVRFTSFQLPNSLFNFLSGNGSGKYEGRNSIVNQTRHQESSLF